jgi:hypothetical protein
MLWGFLSLSGWFFGSRYFRASSLSVFHFYFGTYKRRVRHSDIPQVER